MDGVEPRRPLDRTTGRRAVGRPATIGATRIAQAALAEIDGLTLTAVARRLGVAKSALYHHVRGRDELVELAAGAALRTLRRPEADQPWEAFVRDLAAATRDCLMEHPGLDVALLELHDAPPALWDVLHWASGVLVDAGIDEQTAATVTQLLASMAHDDARHRRATAAAGEDWPDAWLEDRLGIVVDGMRARLSG